MKALQPVDLEYFSSAPHVVTNSGVIHAPRSAVFTAIADDPAGWGRWFPGFTTTGRYITEPPYGVGSVRTVRAFFTDYRETVLAWEPGERWAFRVDETSAPLFAAFAEDYRVSDEGPDATRLTWTVAFTPARFAAGPMRLGRPVLPAGFGLVARRVVAGLERQLAGRDQGAR